METDADGSRAEIAAALRHIARGLGELADALTGGGEPPEEDRVAALLGEWGDRGLTRTEASALFRRHGFKPQTAGGWARADWIVTRAGLRYVSERSLRWLADREDRP